MRRGDGLGDSLERAPQQRHERLIPSVQLFGSVQLNDGYSNAICSNALDEHQTILRSLFSLQGHCKYLVRRRQQKIKYLLIESSLE